MPTGGSAPPWAPPPGGLPHPRTTYLGGDHFTRLDPERAMRRWPAKPTSSASPSASTPSQQADRLPEPVTAAYAATAIAHAKLLRTDVGSHYLIQRHLL